MMKSVFRYHFFVRRAKISTVAHHLCRSRRHAAPIQMPSQRCFSSETPSIKMPGPSTTTWERGAIAVKNTDVSNPYLEAIRDTHDPSLHLKTIEDELKGTIGKALGKQGDKIFHAVYRMNEEFKVYQEELDKNETIDHPNVQASAKRYNELRKQAIHARWELMVHRQAAGFIVNNHR